MNGLTNEKGSNMIRKLLAAVVAIIFIILIYYFSVADNVNDINLNKPIITEVDVIVIGSDPEGIAAAISASRNGLNTLLIDTRPEVGGLFTRGWLNSLDMIRDPNGEIVNKGIFMEWFKKIEGDSFQIETSKEAFEDLLYRERNLAILLDVEEMHPEMVEGQDGMVAGIRVVKDGKETLYKAKTFIDATQNADIAYEAGVEFTVGQEDYLGSSRNMASTLVFEIKNIDWSKIKKYLKNDGNADSDANEVSAYGYNQMFDYIPKDPDVDIRGLNIGRISDDAILINALYVFGIDGLDPSSYGIGREKAKAELEHILPFIREHLPGFENAELGRLAPEWYIRETRHMKGLYRLTLNDVLGNKDFEDRIGFGSYPVDIQAFSPTELGYVVGKPIQYAVPFRSIVPEKMDNLLVVGRAASFDSLAHGSARVVPVGMATGQAAGVASALAIEGELSFREIAETPAAIRVIQQKLIKQGVELEAFDYPEELQSHWAYEGTAYIRSLGMISAGYKNDYNLDQKLKEKEFYGILYNAVRRSQVNPEFPYAEISGELITKEQMAKLLVDAFEVPVNESKPVYQHLMQSFSFSEETIRHLEESAEVSRAVAYSLISEMIKSIGVN